MNRDEITRSIQEQIDRHIWEAAGQAPEFYTASSATPNSQVTFADLKRTLDEIEAKAKTPPLAAVRMGLDEFEEAIKPELGITWYREDRADCRRLYMRNRTIESNAPPFYWAFGILHCKEVRDYRGNPWVIVGNLKQIEDAVNDPIALLVALARAANRRDSEQQ